MALPKFNWNNGQAIVNGAGIGTTFCPITVPITQVVNQNAAQNPNAMLDLVSYLVVGGTGITTGTVGFQELLPDGVTWVTLALPAPVPITASNQFNNVINGPFLGVRMILTVALAGGNLTTVMLKGSLRTM